MNAFVDEALVASRMAGAGIDLLALEEDALVERIGDTGEKPSNYEAIIEYNRDVAAIPPEEGVELELGPNNCSA